jgi:3-oxoacyl-[acyl-carrier protein] reductase
VCARREAEISAAAREIAEATGAEVMPVVADMTKPADIGRLVETTFERFGAVHVLVNNAGGPPAGDILKLTDEQWEEGFQLTLMSMVRCTRAVLPRMIAQKWGRIITITSIAAKQPINELLLSSTIRPGIQGLTRVLSSLHAASNITVNTICPGFILTKRQEELSHARASQRNLTFDQYLGEQAMSIPAGRLGRPEEVGDVVAFLASEQASYINGTNLLVDGGLARGVY